MPLLQVCWGYQTELVADGRNDSQACTRVQSTSPSHRSQPAARTSCHPTQTRHVFMSALPTSPQLSPPRLYQENPFLQQLAPLQLLYSTAKAGETLCPGNTFSSALPKSCKLIQEGSVIRCLEGDTPIPAGTSQSWNGSSGPTLAPFAQTEVEILLSMLNEQDKSHFCDAHPNTPVDSLQDKKPTYKKKLPECQGKSQTWGRVPVRYPTALLGWQAGQTEGSASSGCVPYRRQHKPSKLDRFPPQWPNTPLLT